MLSFLLLFWITLFVALYLTAFCRIIKRDFTETSDGPTTGKNELMLLINRAADKRETWRLDSSPFPNRQNRARWLIFGFCVSYLSLSLRLMGEQARSKLPKKRRSVLPVEQIRRKQQQQNRSEGGGGLQRRMNAFKHNPPAMMLKDAMVATFGAGNSIANSSSSL